jgi:hypothetical protein
MNKPNMDAGTLQVLVERMQSQRLPRAMALKDKVDRGEMLDDFDLAFLQEVVNDASAIRPLVDAHPEWHDLVAKVSNLYKEIADKALANAQSQKG